MPTKRPRITVTETPDLARRLNLAAAQLPERSRSRAELLLALTELGENALVENRRLDGKRENAKAFILEHTAGITAEQGDEMLDAREAEWSRDPY